MKSFYKISKKNIEHAIFASSLSILLLGCDPVTMVLGGGAVAGTVAVRNQEGIVGSVSDASIQTRVNQALFNGDKEIFDRTELSIKHGMVVVIGYLKNEEQCRKAIDIVKGVSGVRQVFDETSVQEPPKGKDLAIDSSITSRIKSALTFDGNVQSLNYDVTTVKGIVYICGTAQTKYERDVVFQHAKTTSGVGKVVAYVKVLKNPDSGV